MGLIQDIFESIKNGMNNYSSDVKRYEEMYREKFEDCTLDEIEPYLVKIIHTEKFTRKAAAFNILRSMCDSDEELERRLAKYRKKQ